MAEMSQPVAMTETQITDLNAVCSQYGISWNGEYKTSDCGNIQISINVPTTDLLGKNINREYVITYDANNPHCFDNVCTYMKGAGGDAVYASKEYNSDFDKYYLEATPHNHVMFNCKGSAGPMPTGATAAILEALSGNDNQRVYVDAASSAGTQSIPSMAISQFDNASAIYYMPIEAKGDGTPPGEPMYKFVLKSLEGHPELKDKVAGLYAFEAANGGLTGPPSNALKYLSKTANDMGIPGYMMVDPKLNGHAGKTSPDAYLSNGFIDDFFETVNPSSSSSDNEDGNITIASNDKETTIDENKTPLQFYNITEGAMTTITAAEFIASLVASTDIDFSIDFDSVMENTALMGKSITNTSLRDRAIQPCTSEARFPYSLNEGCSYLYGSSKNLLYKMSRDVQSFEKIAAILQKVDENELISLMNSTVGTDNALGYGLEVQSLAFIDDGKNSYPYVFSDLLSKGVVGSITMADIDSILQGNTLIGSIGNGLNDEIDEATRMINDIAAMKESTKMTGPIWDLLCQRLDTYSICCNARIDAAKHMQETYISALNAIKDYYNETAALLAGSKINMNGALDDSQIPVCEATIAELEQDILNLQAEYAECSAVSPIRGTGRKHVDENGREWEETEPNEPQYTIAQNRMKEIMKVDIPEKKADIAYNNTYIERLQGVAQLMNNVNETIQQAIDYASSEYINLVNSIEPLNVPEFASI